MKERNSKLKMEVMWALLRPFNSLLGKRADAITDAPVSVSPGRLRRLSSITGDEAKIFDTVSPKLAICFLKNADSIWQYLDLDDLLTFSITSRFCANLFISQQLILKNMESCERRLAGIGNFKISFASELTLGIFRRLLNRIVNGKKAVVSIDMETGRVNMDIGSAFKEEGETTIAAEIEEVDRISKRDIKLPPIDSILEAYSIDEYDDFNPKHPIFSNLMRGRRGTTSYFSSSDFEEYAKENLEKTNSLTDLEMWSLNNSSYSSMGSMEGSVSRMNSKGGMISTSTSANSFSPRRFASASPSANTSAGSTPARTGEGRDDEENIGAYLLNDDSRENDDNDADDEDDDDEEDEEKESDLVASTFEYVISDDRK